MVRPLVFKKALHFFFSSLHLSSKTSDACEKHYMFLNNHNMEPRPAMLVKSFYWIHSVSNHCFLICTRLEHWPSGHPSPDWSRLPQMFCRVCLTIWVTISSFQRGSYPSQSHPHWIPALTDLKVCSNPLQNCQLYTSDQCNLPLYKHYWHYLFMPSSFWLLWTTSCSFTTSTSAFSWLSTSMGWLRRLVSTSTFLFFDSHLVADNNGTKLHFLDILYHVFDLKIKQLYLFC